MEGHKTNMFVQWIEIHCYNISRCYASVFCNLQPSNNGYISSIIKDNKHQHDNSSTDQYS